MTSLKLKAGHLPAQVDLPSSKSYANRALILAALHKELITLDHVPEADDVMLLVEALKKIGLEIKKDLNQIKVFNSFPECEKADLEKIISLDVGEGGTTARFLAVLLALGKNPYLLKLGPRLSQRPWDELLKNLNELGSQAKLDGTELFIQGPMKIPQELFIDCRQTTQVATAFQLVLSLSGTVIHPLNLKSSESYWFMTNEIILNFKQSQTYRVPLDWSSASYPLVFGALHQKIFFPGLFPDKFQADSKLYGILEEMDAVKLSVDGIHVGPGKKDADLKINCSDCLDLVPALVFYLSHIQGTHELIGLENLLHKESDRLGELSKLLENLKIKSQKSSSSLVIYGQSDLNLPTLDLTFPEDHRLVMTGALFLRLHAGGTITPATAVSKSFPQFFDLMPKD